MNIKRALLLTAAVLSLCAVSCKKDDEEDIEYKYLNGVLSFDIPSFVRPGEEYTLVPRGVTHPSGNMDDIGYYWTVDPFHTSRDTTKWAGNSGIGTEDGRYYITVQDTLITMTITGYAYASEYTPSSATKTVTIVKDGDGEGCTLQGRSFSGKTFTDPRDGRVYPYTRIGNLDWFSKNLAYQPTAVSFKDSEAVKDILGGYYTWEDAREACPEGWRLPSQEDWFDLARAISPDSSSSKDDIFRGIAGNLMANVTFNGIRMWEYWPSVNISNSVLFNAMPTGYCVDSDEGEHSFTGSDAYSVLWSSDQLDEEQGLYRYIYMDSPDIRTGSGHKGSFRCPVRCVR